MPLTGRGGGGGRASSHCAVGHVPANRLEHQPVRPLHPTAPRNRQEWCAVTASHRSSWRTRSKPRTAQASRPSSKRNSRRQSSSTRVEGGHSLGGTSGRANDGGAISASTTCSPSMVLADVVASARDLDQAAPLLLVQACDPLGMHDRSPHCPEGGGRRGGVYLVWDGSPPPQGQGGSRRPGRIVIREPGSAPHMC